MNFEVFMQTASTVIASSTVGGVIGAVVNQFWSRRSAKKGPKTQERAKAYEALIVHLASSIGEGKLFRPEDKESNLQALLARIVVYGESDVVLAVAKFIQEYRFGAEGTPVAFLVDTVLEMRKSLLTGAGYEVRQAIEGILGHQVQPQP